MAPVIGLRLPMFTDGGSCSQPQVTRSISMRGGSLRPRFFSTTAIPEASGWRHRSTTCAPKLSRVLRHLFPSALANSAVLPVWVRSSPRMRSVATRQAAAIKVLALLAGREGNST